MLNECFLLKKSKTLFGKLNIPAALFAHFYCLHNWHSTQPPSLSTLTILTTNPYRTFFINQKWNTNVMAHQRFFLLFHDQSSILAKLFSRTVDANVLKYVWVLLWYYYHIHTNTFHDELFSNRTVKEMPVCEQNNQNAFSPKANHEHKNISSHICK